VIQLRVLTPLHFLYMLIKTTLHFNNRHEVYVQSIYVDRGLIEQNLAN